MTELNSPEDYEEQEIFCLIHEKVQDDEIEEIHKNLCSHTEILEHSDGNYYCLFHSPTDEKDIEEFAQKFSERLAAFELSIAEAETEDLPVNERQAVNGKIFYDFRYVYFPEELDLQGYKFNAAADFSRAYFFEGANFCNVEFTRAANFSGATFGFYAQFMTTTFKGVTDFMYADFLSAAYFTRTIFAANIYFDSATFNEGAFFGETVYLGEAAFGGSKFLSDADFGGAVFVKIAKFHESEFYGTAYLTNIIFVYHVHFRKVKILSEAYFNYTVFADDVSFDSAKFGAESKIVFKETQVCRVMDFTGADVAGDVSFEYDVFLDNERITDEVIPELKKVFKRLEKESGKRGIETGIPLPNIEENQEAILNLKTIRLREPEQFVFTETGLRPNWFIQVDKAKSIKFDEIVWRLPDTEIASEIIEKELENLRNRYTEKPEKHLRIVYYRLADNAEANYRFKEAKYFRKLGETIGEE